MALKAPYRFAPTARWVYQPRWGRLASHDVPFKDGVSGEVSIEIEAVTPLLVGGPRRVAVETREGEVAPVQIGNDGTYMIPPSSLQGMTRSILEIAAFGRIGPFVDDKRFGIRDLTGPANVYFANRLNNAKGHNPTQIIPNVRAGWLQQVKGQLILTPCQLARIEFSDLERFCIPSELVVLRQSGSVKGRYEMLQTVDVQVNVLGARPYRHGKPGKPLDITYCKASPVAKPNGLPGKLVMTGLTRDAFKPHRSGHKHMEFVFFDERPNDAFPLELGKFDEFLSIHEPKHGRPANANWTYYNLHGYPGAGAFRDGGRMPVFYLPKKNADGGDQAKSVDSFGLAFMFKLAHAHSTHALLNNSSPAHTAKRGHVDGEIDLPSLIFGELGDIGDSSVSTERSGLKRRAAFDVARLVDPKTRLGLVSSRNNAILLSPKPSYYPIYVRQQRVDGPTSGIAATYTPLTRALLNKGDSVSIPMSHSAPELSGPKIWPTASRPQGSQFIPEVPAALRSNLAIQNRLHALPARTRFSTTLRVHNLRRVELGALLWALTFGDERALTANDSSLRHRLGMGKPFGLGEISIKVTGCKLDANTKTDAGDLFPVALVKSFTDHMQRVYADALVAREAKPDKQKPSHDWIESAQVVSLLKAANPQLNEFSNPPYMPLSIKIDNPREPGKKMEGPGAYVGEKANLTGLPGYGPQLGGEFPRTLSRATDDEGDAMKATGVPTIGVHRSDRTPQRHSQNQMQQLQNRGDENQPREASQSKASTAPKSVALDPRIGDRVLIVTGVEGLVVGEPKDKNSPSWHILLDGAQKPKSFTQGLIKAVIRRADGASGAASDTLPP